MTRRTLLTLLLTVTIPAAAQTDPLAPLRRPGAVVLLRHAHAPGTGDPANFRLGDCTTQRNLDDTGRAQARRIGERLRAAGVTATVASSAWCRTQETAALLDLGQVQVLPILNSFFADSAAGPPQTAALRAVVAEPASGLRIMVTHQVNITALTGIFPADAEMVVVDRDSRVLARIPSQ